MRMSLANLNPAWLEKKTDPNLFHSASCRLKTHRSGHFVLKESNVYKKKLINYYSKKKKKTHKLEIEKLGETRGAEKHTQIN